MFHVRTTKTGSRATAVQVIRYKNGRKIVEKHIGSAHTSQELAVLKEASSQWIQQTTHQRTLFPPERTQTEVFLKNTYSYLGFRYTFMYESMHQVFHRFQFDRLNPLLLDLVLMRIIEPVSKRESLELLAEFFGITYHRTDFYRSIPSFVSSKMTLQECVVTIARNNFSFDFSIVFYDVTTLYFETSKEDEEQESIRKPGFSKDNKPNQPQVVIGLIVTKEGFPVAYEVFAGNTFEGKTFIPTITKFKQTYQIQTLTIVADAAMISFDNVEKLKEQHLSYIVGARVANLKLEQMRQINKELVDKRQTLEELVKVDGSSIRVTTERGLLVCDFSFARYKKDKREMEKQIAKAEKLLEENKGIKRIKFLMSRDEKKTEQILNTELIERAKLLLGIKGYYTNLTEVDNETIISHYHNLWHVEKAFRMAKSDLQMRPMYHFKKQAIEAHILICFMALAVCKYMELKTGKSTRRIVKLLRSITEARIKNKLTGEIIVMRQELPEEVEQLWKTLSLRY